MSNFMRKEICPYCNQEADIVYADLGLSKYKLLCLKCESEATEGRWKRKQEMQKALKELQEEHGFGGDRND